MALAFGSDSPVTAHHKAPGSAVSVRAAFPPLDDDDPSLRCLRTVHRGEVTYG